MTTYIAENIETGEVIEGGVRDIARKLGVVPNTICNAVSAKSKVKFVWVITKRVGINENPYKFPQALLDEWNLVTEKFRKASARKGCRNAENKKL